MARRASGTETADGHVGAAPGASTSATTSATTGATSSRGRGGGHGVALALALPLLLVAAVGVLTLRSIAAAGTRVERGTVAAVRDLAGGRLPGATPCTTPLAPGATGRPSVCAVRAHLPSGAQQRAAVHLVVDAGGRPSAVVACVEARVRSFAGPLRPVIGARLLRTRASYPVVAGADVSSVEAAAEPPLSGSWSWCHA